MKLLTKLRRALGWTTLKEHPYYRPQDFWIHQNGILKGNCIHALWEEKGGQIKVYFYGTDPENAPPRVFNSFREAYAFLKMEA